jgi:hypothetical protein
MRWPWSTPAKESPVPDNDINEAIVARRRAEAALRRTEEISGEIRRVTDRSAKHRRGNHFAQLIAETFRRSA